MRKSVLGLSLVVLLATGACEKSGSSDIKGSGDLSADEAKLLGYVPASANVVFGGDYAKFMDYWENSPLRTFAEEMMDKLGSDNKMREYMNCWIEKERDTKLAGAMGFGAGTPWMTMVFDGMSAETLESCSEKGGYQLAKDADGKYMEIQGVPDGMGGTTSVGYYFITPSTVYFAMSIPVGGVGGALPKVNRADLEARLAEAKKAPASQSDDIKSMLKKADRKRAFWFAGSAKGTPAASAMTDGYGYLDADKNSITFGFSLNLTDADDASKAVSQFKQLKDQIGMLPPNLKPAAEAFLKDAKLSASGKTLNGTFRLTNDVLKKALPAVQGLMGRPGAWR